MRFQKLRYALIGLWLVVVCGALALYFLRRDFIEAELRNALSMTSIVAAMMYLVLGSIRAFTLIPATFLILAALPFFKPWPLFLLTLAGIVISSSSIYWFAEVLNLDEFFERNHKAAVDRTRRALERYELPIVIGWSFMPFTPTDVICYVCGALDVDFRKFLLGVLIGEGAICAIYIFFGGYLLDGLSFGL